MGPENASSMMNPYDGKRPLTNFFFAHHGRDDGGIRCDREVPLVMQPPEAMLRWTTSRFLAIVAMWTSIPSFGAAVPT